MVEKPVAEPHFFGREVPGSLGRIDVDLLHVLGHRRRSETSWPASAIVARRLCKGHRRVRSRVCSEEWLWDWENASSTEWERRRRRHEQGLQEVVQSWTEDKEAWGCSSHGGVRVAYTRSRTLLGLVLGFLCFLNEEKKLGLAQCTKGTLWPI